MTTQFTPSTVDTADVPGHSDEVDTKNATMTYVKAAVHDVATTLSALTGEPHPLGA